MYVPSLTPRERSLIMNGFSALKLECDGLGHYQQQYGQRRALPTPLAAPFKIDPMSVGIAV